MTVDTLTLAEWRSRAELYENVIASALRSFGNHRPVSHYDTGEIRADFEGYARELKRLTNAEAQRESSPTRREIDALLSDAGVPLGEHGMALGVAARLARYMESARASHNARRAPPSADEVRALLGLWDGAAIFACESAEPPCVPVLVYKQIQPHGVGTLCDVIFVEVHEGDVVACDKSVWELDDYDVTGFVMLGPKGPLTELELARLVAGSPDAATPPDAIRDADVASRAWQRAVDALQAEAKLPEWDWRSVHDMRGRMWGEYEGSVYAFGRNYVRQIGLTCFPRVEFGAATLMHMHTPEVIVALTSARRDDAQVASRIAADELELASLRAREEASRQKPENGGEP